MKLESQSLLIAKRQKQFRIAPRGGQALKKLIEAGLTWLRTNQQTVNVLNVFPVPDGDTGINMVLTMQSAYDEIAGSPERNLKACPSMGAMRNCFCRFAINKDCDSNFIKRSVVLGRKSTRGLIQIADPQSTHMDVDLVYWHSQGFLDMEPHGVGNTAGYGLDACPVFDDNINIDVDVLAVVSDFDPLGWVFDKDIGQTVDQVFGCQSNNAIGLQGSLKGNGGDCPGCDMDAANGSGFSGHINLCYDLTLSL